MKIQLFHLTAKEYSELLRDQIRLDWMLRNPYKLKYQDTLITSRRKLYRKMKEEA